MHFDWLWAISLISEFCFIFCNLTYFQWRESLLNVELLYVLITSDFQGEINVISFNSCLIIRIITLLNCLSFSVGRGGDQRRGEERGSWIEHAIFRFTTKHSIRLVTKPSVIGMLTGCPEALLFKPVWNWKRCYLFCVTHFSIRVLLYEWYILEQWKR